MVVFANFVGPFEQFCVRISGGFTFRGGLLEAVSMQKFVIIVSKNIGAESVVEGHRLDNLLKSLFIITIFFFRLERCISHRLRDDQNVR